MRPQKSGLMPKTKFHFSLFNKFADMSRWQQNRNRNEAQAEMATEKRGRSRLVIIKKEKKKKKTKDLSNELATHLTPNWAGTMATLESHFSRFPAWKKLSRNFNLHWATHTHTRLSPLPLASLRLSSQMANQ